MATTLRSLLLTAIGSVAVLGAVLAMRATTGESARTGDVRCPGATATPSPDPAPVTVPAPRSASVLTSVPTPSLRPSWAPSADRQITRGDAGAPDGMPPSVESLLTALTAPAGC
ncbi:hypothetical protein FHR32_004658 [Streptosporangium album]|uniref:Uncharacterized protein n=1 Tax=Streptosporangium album TaxID=47479 RepID=A0A7W7RY02_9ACTN|nr:hypothetical protein [Streptosporangium album]MBB4940353.1 hypothetical protein [Streptosporangium album]